MTLYELPGRLFGRSRLIPIKNTALWDDEYRRVWWQSVEEIRERRRNPKSPNPKPERENGKKREGQDKKEENTTPLSLSAKRDLHAPLKPELQRPRDFSQKERSGQFLETWIANPRFSQKKADDE